MARTTLYEKIFDVADPATNLSTRFKNIILTYMTKTHVRMSDLALRMGVTKHQVTMLFSYGGNWTVGTIAKMCDALDIEIEIKLRKRKKAKHII